MIWLQGGRRSTLEIFVEVMMFRESLSFWAAHQVMELISLVAAFVILGLLCWWFGN